MILHPFPPLFDARSKILILGSFPSVRSREEQFFYGHPQNRFWPLLARLLGEETPQTIEAKKRLMLSHGVALWDTVAACDIVGSADASIENAVPNDLGRILWRADIRQIFCNGKTAYQLYLRHLADVLGQNAIALPSTSPANAAWSADKLFEAWQIILPYLTDPPEGARG